MVDINAERLDFAKSYVATDIFQPVSKKPDRLGKALHVQLLTLTLTSKSRSHQPPPNPNEARPDFSKRAADAMMSELKIETRGWDAIDLVIEATGAEPCVQMGLHLVKPA